MASLTAPAMSSGARPKKLPWSSKRAAVLRTILKRGKLGLNCFEAVRLCHDYVLRSTISDLTRQHGIQFARRWEQVPGHAGSKVGCVRYWLTGTDAIKAETLLDEADGARHLAEVAHLLRDLGEGAAADALLTSQEPA